MNRILMIDPPSGNKYGFPKAIPESGTIYYGSKYDYGLRDDFNLLKWLVSKGYPQKEIDNCGGKFVSSFWTEPKEPVEDT